MSESIVLRTGTHGEAVRDLQLRLAGIGLGHDPDELGEFGPGTAAAVRAFQTERGLQVDGEVGRHTWASLVESGFTLGDRLLYFRHPMLRGDDVAQVQRQLNSLGFDARRVDGIYGADTHRALIEFQRSTGLAADGVCGPDTIAALERVGGFADGSVAAAREREVLRQGPPGLDARSVFVATTPGLAVVGDAVVRGLMLARARTVHDSSGDDESLVARAANSFGADLFVGFRSATSGGPQCTYFETTGFRSETGFHLAEQIRIELVRALGTPVGLSGRAYPLLRETQMAAVVCELIPEGDGDALAGLVRRSGAVARGVVQGIRVAYETARAGPEAL